MKTRRLIALVLAALFVSLCCFPGLASDDREHWGNQISHNRWTNAIVFGNPSIMSCNTVEIRNAIGLLDDAVLICIDQFNGKYEDKLKALVDAGVANIPRDLSAINFSANSTSHRFYTHRGWNYGYTPTEYEKGHADTRRELLYAVVSHVFDFPHSGLSADVAKDKCEAMCCLLYVSHIIGDRYHSEKYYGAAVTQVLADSSGKGTVIGDLVEILPTLLSESDCSGLIMKLKNLSAEIVRNERDLAGTELLMVDSDYAKELKELLEENLPELLRKQSWFSAIFEEKWMKLPEQRAV